MKDELNQTYILQFDLYNTLIFVIVHCFQRPKLWRSPAHVLVLLFTILLRNLEVGDLNFAIAGNKNVQRLHVAVNEAGD